MKLARILAVARRIAQGFRRDERTLALMFVVPLVVTALLGWVLRDSKETTTRIVAANEAGAIGQRIVDALTTATTGATDGPELIGWTETKAAAIDQIRSGQADLAVVIPATLAADVLSGNRPTFTIITDGTDPAADASRIGALQGLMLGIAGDIAPPGSTAPLIPKIERETVYLSDSADTLDVLAPVFLAYFAYFFVFLLTGISFLRERLGGTLERLLATPVTRGEIVTGYSLGFGIFATLQVILLTAFVLSRLEVPALGPLPAFTVGLHVPSVGSPALAFVITLVLSLGAVSLGIFLSTFARTELQVIQFIPLVIIPQGLLGGIFWPVDKLPDFLHAIANVLPMTYAVDALREVMLKGADLGSDVVRFDLGVLVAIAVVFVVLAGTTIKREVA